ncbi:hypothetical protein FBQ97_12875 [Acidobacteria bacterium ACD]|nr:hypothetical protein [Acidobacteria bacterium ACD]
MELTNLDIALRKTDVYRIRGRALDTNGDPLQRFIVTATRLDRAGAGPAGFTGSPRQDGTFEVANLPPGDYRVMVRRLAGGPQNQAMVTEMVALGSTDVEGLVVQVSPGFAVGGRVVVEGRVAGSGGLGLEPLPAVPVEPPARPLPEALAQLPPGSPERRRVRLEPPGAPEEGREELLAAPAAGPVRPEVQTDDEAVRAEGDDQRLARRGGGERRPLGVEPSPRTGLVGDGVLAAPRRLVEPLVGVLDPGLRLAGQRLQGELDEGRLGGSLGRSRGGRGRAEERQEEDEPHARILPGPRP